MRGRSRERPPPARAAGTPLTRPPARPPRRISWYMVLFVVVNFAFCVWGFSIVEGSSSGACGDINRFDKLVASVSLIEAVVNGLLAAGFLVLMHGAGPALFTLVLLVVYGALMFIKTTGAVLGVVWLWADQMETCKASHASLWHHGDQYLKGVLLVLAIQWMVGSFLLLALGLANAVDEAYYTMRLASGELEDEDDEEVTAFL